MTTFVPTIFHSKTKKKNHSELILTCFFFGTTHATHRLFITPNAMNSIINISCNYAQVENYMNTLLLLSFFFFRRCVYMFVMQKEKKKEEKKSMLRIMRSTYTTEKSRPNWIIIITFSISRSLSLFLSLSVCVYAWRKSASIAWNSLTEISIIFVFRFLLHEKCARCHHHKHDMICRFRAHHECDEYVL